MRGSWRLSLGLLLALVFFAHLGALSGLPVWDDWEVMEAGATDPAVSWEARPLRELTILWDRWAWDGDPRGMRLTNLLLHGACAAGVWSLARAWGASWQGALIAGAAYGIHPVLSEVVASVANRKESLLVLMTVLSVLSFLRLRAGGNRAWLAASFLFFAFALMAKETAVAVPLLLLLCDVIRSGGWRKVPWGAHLPFFGIAGLAAWIFFLRLAGADPAGRVVRIDLFGLSGPDLVSVAGDGFWRSVTLLAVPAGLCADHPIPSGGTRGMVGTALLALSIITAASCLVRSACREGEKGTWGLPAAWLWMVAGWLPTAVFLNPASFPVAERYWALPWVGGALWSGLLLDRLSPRLSVAGPAFAAVLLFWTVAGTRQDRRWLENHRLATAAIVENPRSWMARIDRANLEAGIARRRDLAGVQFARAAAIQPLAGHVDFYRGRWELSRGRPVQAMERFVMAWKKGFESSELFACGIDAAVRAGNIEWTGNLLGLADRSGRSGERLARRLAELAAAWEADGATGASADLVARWRKGEGEASVPR